MSLIYNPQGQKPVRYGDWLKEQEQDRKTHYAILASYQGGLPEEIDEADTLDDADFVVSEYRVAFGSGWRVWHKVKRGA